MRSWAVRGLRDVGGSRLLSTIPGLRKETERTVSRWRVSTSRNRLPEGAHRFIDFKRVRITAGNGGDGAISFARGSGTPFGPPSGGSGGRGGDVYIVASKEITSLGSLESRYKAGNGYAGASNRRHGAQGQDLEIHVPIGTRILEVREAQEPTVSQQTLEIQKNKKKQRNSQDPVGDLEMIQEYFKFKVDYTPQQDRIEMLKERIPKSDSLEEPIALDLLKEGERILVAKGGRGGYGNPHFVTPTISGPGMAGRGLKGAHITLEIELKTLADAGLVGLPNAGKSTLLAAVSEAHPKIAPYPFTTMNPYIGTIDYPDKYTLTLADIPGLIKGAHRNVGLGHRFLRHVERSKMLVYVIDLGGSAPWTDLSTLQSELEAYKPGLTAHPSLIVANKADLGKVARENLKQLTSMTNLPIVPVSAKEGKNITILTALMRQIVDKHRADASKVGDPPTSRDHE